MNELRGSNSERDQTKTKINGAESLRPGTSDTSFGASQRSSGARSAGPLGADNQPHGQQKETPDGAMSSVGETISHLGHAMKESLPQSGTVGKASAAIADSLKSSGEYLETHGFDEMSKDLTDVIRNHPVPAVWIGLGVGFLVGQAWMRK